MPTKVFADKNGMLWCLWYEHLYAMPSPLPGCVGEWEAAQVIPGDAMLDIHAHNLARCALMGIPV